MLTKQEIVTKTMDYIMQKARTLSGEEAALLAFGNIRIVTAFARFVRAMEGDGCEYLTAGRALCLAWQEEIVAWKHSLHEGGLTPADAEFSCNQKKD